MDENIVDFPEEADNTQFNAHPTMPIAELREKFRELVDRQNTQQLLGEEFDFEITNEYFAGCIRVFLTTDHLTNEIPYASEVYFLSGPAVLLDIDGEETDTRLQMGGQVDFLDDESDVQLGTLNVWRPHTDFSIGMLDAS